MRPACFSKAASLVVFAVFTSATLILPARAQTPAAPAATEAEAVKKLPVKPPVKPPAKPAPANAKPAATNNVKAPANGSTGASPTATAATTNAVAAPNGRSPIPARGNTNVVNANNGANTANPATTNNLVNNATNTTSNGRPAIPASNTAAGTPAANNATSNSTARGGINTPGLHVFRWGDYQATAYGCSRSGTRVLCDFDLTKDNAVQANQNVWNGLILLDQGGKIVRRHDAFFLFADGSQANSAYLSSGTPVRMIMEFDGVNANSSSVSLSVGQDRVDGVPVTAEQNSAPAQKQ